MGRWIRNISLKAKVGSRRTEEKINSSKGTGRRGPGGAHCGTLSGKQSSHSHVRIEMIQNRNIFHHEFGRNVAKSNDEGGTAKKKDGRKKSRKVRYLVEN